MRWMSNREREARKAKKATQINDGKKRQLHISYHIKRGYHEIVSMVKAGTNNIVVRNAHKRHGQKRKPVEKVVVRPKILFNGGTYIRAIHGELKV